MSGIIFVLLVWLNSLGDAVTCQDHIPRMAERRIPLSACTTFGASIHSSMDFWVVSMLLFVKAPGGSDTQLGTKTKASDQWF